MAREKKTWATQEQPKHFTGIYITKYVLSLGHEFSASKFEESTQANFTTVGCEDCKDQGRHSLGILLSHLLLNGLFLLSFTELRYSSEIK